MSALREGDRINNYLLDGPLGKGSFGEVWSAKHHVFGDRVAIKVPTDPQYVRNLQREGVVVHGLKHPNIVRVLDLDPYATPPYLIMELVDGPSLRDAIDSLRGSFPIHSAVSIMRGILSALSVAHDADLIHRDIKPANVLLSHPLADLGEIPEQAVKVTDFGLGKVGGDTTQSLMQSGSLLTEDGRSIAGTLAYMSPEQKEGLDVDARSDLYACGIVLFEMLTGERPQGSDTPSMLRPDVPPHLDEVFTRAYTHKDRRFESAREMLAALAPSEARPALAEPVRPAFGARGVDQHKCPACGAGVHRDDQFCIACGRQLVASVPRCASCHAFVHVGDRFCIFCGNDLQVMA